MIAPTYRFFVAFFLFAGFFAFVAFAFLTVFFTGFLAAAFLRGAAFLAFFFTAMGMVGKRNKIWTLLYAMCISCEANGKAFHREM